MLILQLLFQVTMDTTITVSAVNYQDAVGQLSPGSGYSWHWCIRIELLHVQRNDA